ncbi:MAG TPA: hypothetical protein VK842_02485, partial [bacterium]|nr:hypothetical protein [bacterium]
MEPLRRLARARLSPGQALAATALLLAALAWTLLLSAGQSRAGLHDYSVGDWLINDGGGWVRRGLAGSLIVRCAEWTGARPEALVALAKIFFFLPLYLLGAFLLLRPRPAPFLLALALLSPAVLLFPLENPAGTGRKEIAALLWAALAAVRAARSRPAPGKLGLCLVLLLLTALHDGLFFFIPSFLLLRAFLFPEETWTPRQWAMVLLPACAYMAWVVAAGPASSAQINAMILAFHGTPSDWSDGAFQFLAQGWQGALAATRAAATVRTVGAAAAGAALGALPAGLWLYADPDARRRWAALASRTSIRMLAGAAVLSQCALMALSLDWGRWLAVDLTLAALA